MDFQLIFKESFVNNLILNEKFKQKESLVFYLKLDLIL